MLEKIRHRLLLLEPVERKYILTHGQPFAKPFRNNAKRDRFMKLIQKFSMEKALECCERDHFDVGIFGGWSDETMAISYPIMPWQIRWKIWAIPF